MATYKELRAQRKELGHTVYPEMIQNYSDKAKELEAAAEDILSNGLYEVWKAKKNKAGLAFVTENEIETISNGAIPKGVIPGYCSVSPCYGEAFTSKSGVTMRVCFYRDGIENRMERHYRMVTHRYVEIDENGNQIGDVIEKRKKISLYKIEMCR